MKLTVIGAGSTYSPEIFDGIIRRKDSLPIDQVVLMDIDANKLSIVGGFIERMLRAGGLGNVRCIQTDDLDTALRGADYVIAQIRVGQLPARIKDEKIPLKYGLIGQETTGIGGFFNALRTIPPILHIAKRMEELCPNAWLINFSNPSGIVAQAVQSNSSIKMVGLCNCPINTLMDCRAWLNDPDASIEYVGLNHLSWVTKVMSHQENELQRLLQQGAMGTAKNIPNIEFSMEMLLAAGGIPSSYLNYFYLREEQLERMKNAKLCRGEECMQIEKELLELYQQPELTRKPEQLSKRGGALYSEAAVSLIDCIHNDRNETHVVDIRNNGAIPFLRDDDVVEISSTVRRDSITPQPITVMPNEQIVALIQTVKAYERLTVEAALTGDRIAALRALMVHPLVGDFKLAQQCFDEMLEAHREYLPQFFN